MRYASKLGSRYEEFRGIILKVFLLATKNRVLVEASLKDRIWGIGLSADDKDA